MAQDNEIEKDFSGAFKKIIIFASCLTLLIVISYLTKFHGGLSDEQTRWGEFGDFVGGVLNPVFGFLGLIALLMTISLQSSELRLTRKELHNSSTALNAQNETLVIQNFENSFFQMLKLHNDIVNSIDFVKRALNQPAHTTTGRDCFPIMLRRLRDDYDSKIATTDEAIRMNDAYEVFYSSHQVEVAHYFRYLYNIFKFIDNSDVKNKRFYSNLLRAQLSNHELAILFYNCLSINGKDNFLPLAIKYALFNNMPDSLLLNQTHKSWFPDEAYAQDGSNKLR